MKMPPEYLQPILHSIEGVVVDIHEEFPRLADADVEQVYDKLYNYFKARSQGKDAEEPLSTSEHKQVLSDEILNILEAREEMQADITFVNNPDVTHGTRVIPSLDYLYMIGFLFQQPAQRNQNRR